MKKRLSLITIFFIFCFSASSQNTFDFRIKPGLSIPLSETTIDSMYENGLNIQAMGMMRSSPDSNFFSDIAFVYNNTPTISDDVILNSYALSIGAGIDHKLMPILSIQTGLNAGWYLATADGETTNNPFASGFVDLSFDFNPMFSVLLGTSYNYYLTNNEGSVGDLYQGIAFSLGANYSPKAKVSPADIHIGDIQFLPIFPVFYKYYDKNPLGKFNLTNNEQKPIQDIMISFNVSQYMDTPKECFFIEELRPGETAEIPLNALFNMDIVDLTEPSASAAQVTIDYVWNNTPMTVEVGKSLEIQHRNAMIWDDDRKAAAFVTAGDAYVMQFAKKVAGIVRSAGNSPVNLNYRIALGMFEALKLHGINYVVDPLSSYVELSEDAFSLDYLQFPRQSLAFKAGDCDDLAILYSALLKSVGIETAFITTPGHIYMAFNLGIDEKAVRKNFNNISDIIIRDDEAWVPVEITQIQDGFMIATQTGGKFWRENSSEGKASFFPISEAQEIYNPVGLRPEQMALELPEDEEIQKTYINAFKRFIQSEISDKVLLLEHQIEKSGGKSSDMNRLGSLYAKFGIFDKANDVFLEIIENDEYIPAFVNLGNVSYITGMYDDALDWFTKAYEKNQNSSLILVGLARTNYELGNFTVVDRYFDKLISKNPRIAEKYSYLVKSTDENSRAGIHGKDLEVIWDEVEE